MHYTILDGSDNGTLGYNGRLVVMSLSSYKVWVGQLQVRGEVSLYVYQIKEKTNFMTVSISFILRSLSGF